MTTRPVPLAALVIGLLLISACDRPGVDDSSPEGDLPEMMLYLQRYFEKLQLAGEAGNWELAAFYAHELEEVGKELRDGGFEKNGVDVGRFIEDSFLPAVRAVDAAIDAGPAAFAGGMAELATTCNSCHGATGYGFVRIVVPQENRPFPSQVFSR